MRNIIESVKQLLPQHYEVLPSANPGAIRCRSKQGIENENEWRAIFDKIKNLFVRNFSEVNHAVCHNHTDFTIHLKKMNGIRQDAHEILTENWKSDGAERFLPDYIRYCAANDPDFFAWLFDGDGLTYEKLSGAQKQEYADFLASTE